jgi:hypothetical protein
VIHKPRGRIKRARIHPVGANTNNGACLCYQLTDAQEVRSVELWSDSEFEILDP